MTDMSVTCQDCGKDLTWEGRDYSKCSGCGRDLVLVIAPRGVGTGNGAIIVHSEETARLAARVEALKKALRRYGDHNPYCTFAMNTANRCSCGWWEATSKLLEGK